MLESANKGGVIKTVYFAEKNTPNLCINIDYVILQSWQFTVYMTRLALIVSTKCMFSLSSFLKKEVFIEVRSVDSLFKKILKCLLIFKKLTHIEIATKLM